MPPFRIALALPALAVVLIAGACGGGRYGGGGAASGIEGAVTIGPICPVERQDTPCPDEPFQATIVVEAENGDEVARTESGEDGRFRVELAPGAYTLVPQSPNPGAPPQAAEQQVEVRAGAFASVTIEYDSGIR